MTENHPNRGRKPDDYRLKIIRNDVPTYIVRQRGVVRYMDGREKSLQLEHLVGTDATELRFKLEDALQGSRAGIAVREVLLKLYPHEINRPKVEILP